MKRIALSVALAALLTAFGCKKDGPTTAAGSSGATAQSGGSKTSEPSSGGSLVGKWKGELKMPAKDKEDPAAQMGAAFAKMMLGSLSLEFTSEDRFRLTLMGFPVEGKVERHGNHLVLTPETAMGKPIEEAKKENPSAKTEPMEAEISADGKEITLTDKNAKASEGSMVFTRREDAAKKVGKSTVTADEKAIVGSYAAKLEGDRPTGLSEKEESDLKMAEAMLGSATLDLYEDNTFHMNFMFEMEGKWSVKDGLCTLKMEKMLGMPEGGTSTSKNDMKLKVESGGRLVNDEKGPSGAKMSFIRK